MLLREMIWLNPKDNNIAIFTQKLHAVQSVSLTYYDDCPYSLLTQSMHQPIHGSIA